MPNYDSAGRVPFYLENGVIHFCLVAERDRIVDHDYIEKNCGPAAAHLIPKNMIVLSLPRGAIKRDESPRDAAGRESIEEIDYNPGVTPVVDKKRNIEIAGQQVEAMPYLEKEILVHGKRGPYLLTLFVDRVEPHAFRPKPMESIVEDKIEQRMGHKYQEGGKWATVAELDASLEPLRKLAKHRAVMANNVIGGLVDTHLISMQNQIDAMKEIEAHLTESLRLEGETVRDPSGRTR